MKNITLDIRLIAANPWANTASDFVRATMAKIEAPKRPKKQFLLSRLRMLHGPALALLVILIAVLLSGAVYAAVKFAPSLVDILNKTTSERGTTEYTVTNFKDCSQDAELTASKFELKHDAPVIGDDEVRKILQAKCELAWINKFVGTIWPTYGSHKEWQDGDDIFYTRPDLIGTLQSISKDSVSLSYNSNGEETKTFTAPAGQQITAYANGVRVPLNQLKSNDAVFTVARVAETYFTNRASAANPNPRPLGIVGIIKLSLPRKYYGGMQNYLTPITPCFGNPDESCPQTAMVDVFPRDGGEGASNPAFTQASGIPHSVSGQVTELGDGSLTLKGRSGKLYTVTTAVNAFRDYNQLYAPNYHDMNATVHIGSVVYVIYSQPLGANPTIISSDQLERVTLLLDAINYKSDKVKQY